MRTLRTYLLALLVLPILTAAAPGPGGPGGGTPQHDHSNDANGGPLGSVSIADATVSGNVTAAGDYSFARAADFWDASGQVLFNDWGFIGGTAGSFGQAISWNGYRNNAAGWTSLGLNGSSDGGVLTIDITGIRMFYGTPSATFPPEVVRVDADGLAVFGDLTMGGHAVPWQAAAFITAAHAISRSGNVTGVTSGTTGRSQIDFDGPPVGYGNPICSCAVSGADGQCVIGASTGASAFDVETYADGGGLTDLAYMITCQAYQ